MGGECRAIPSKLQEAYSAWAKTGGGNGNAAEREAMWDAAREAGIPPIEFGSASPEVVRKAIEDRFCGNTSPFRSLSPQEFNISG